MTSLPTRRRSVVCLLALLAAGSTVSGARADALPPGTPAAGTVTLSPSSGPRTTNFSIGFASAQYCPGDANTGYLWGSFITPQTNDPAAKTYTAAGSPAGPTFTAPLRDTSGSAMQAQNPGLTDGLVAVPRPVTFSGVAFDSLPAGDYRLGIACTKADSSSVVQTQKFWATPVTVTATGPSAFTVAIDTTPTLSISGTSITEGDTTTNGTVTVSINFPSSQRVSVDVTSASGTATSGVDFQAVPTTVTIPAGQTSTTVPFTVIGDLAVEGNETFTLTLSNPVNANIGTATGVVTITDDDPDSASPVVRVFPASAVEGGSVAFIVAVDRKPSKSIKVNWSVTLGTASTADLGKLTGTATIGTGSRFTTVSVTTKSDKLVEADETFTLNLTGATNASIAVASATGTIYDDDGANTRLHVGDCTVAEGNAGKKSCTVTLTLTKAATAKAPVTVQLATVAGSAQPGTDFTALTKTVVMKSKTATVQVSVLGDKVLEPTEWFNVAVTSITGATVAKAPGRALIVNDD